jgi:hypothetical protein
MKHGRAIYVLVLASIGATAIGASVATAQPPLPIWHDGFPDPLLPPVHPNPAIAYYGKDLHAMYPQGVILNDPIHRAFTDIVRTPYGSDEHESFHSVLDAMVDVPSMGIFGVPVTLTGPVYTAVHNYTSGQTGTFQTEILSMSLTGSLLGTPVMVRESPTLASTGRVSIEGGGGGGGGYRIESFFDVFTELSIDGGQTWGPDTEGPGVMQLCPEPTSLAILGLGGLVAMRRRRRL